LFGATLNGYYRAFKYNGKPDYSFQINDGPMFKLSEVTPQKGNAPPYELICDNIDNDNVELEFKHAGKTYTYNKDSFRKGDVTKPADTGVTTKIVATAQMPKISSTATDIGELRPDTMEISTDGNKWYDASFYASSLSEFVKQKYIEILKKHRAQSSSPDADYIVEHSESGGTPRWDYTPPSDTINYKNMTTEWGNMKEPIMFRLKREGNILPPMCQDAANLAHRQVREKYAAMKSEAEARETRQHALLDKCIRLCEQVGQQFAMQIGDNRQTTADWKEVLQNYWESSSSSKANVENTITFEGDTYKCELDVWTILRMAANYKSSKPRIFVKRYNTTRGSYENYFEYDLVTDDIKIDSFRLEDV
jgi:hypothetical protein